MTYYSPERRRDEDYVKTATPGPVELPEVRAIWLGARQAVSADSSPEEIQKIKQETKEKLLAAFSEYKAKNSLSDQDVAELAQAKKSQETHRGLDCERFDVQYRGQPLTLILGYGEYFRGYDRRKQCDVSHESYTWGGTPLDSNSGRQMIHRIKVLAYCVSKIERSDRSIDGAVSFQKSHREELKAREAKEAAVQEFRNQLLGPRAEQERE